MIEAYKYHSQFILILVVMYVMGVWLDPLIYVVFPIFLIAYGVKGRLFELLIMAIWMLILSDYIPVKDATYADLQFAKDLKPLIPLALFGFFLMHRDRFRPVPSFLKYFIPFFIVTFIALMYSIKIQVGIQKTISYVLMYTMIPIYTNTLHKEEGEDFWKALYTFIIGMLSIGVVLGAVIPQIGILEGTSRFKGIFGNPNGLGVFLNLAFILWIVLEEFQLAKFSKKERWFILAILLISVFWSGSRNGIMSITIFYLVYKAVKFNWFAGVIVISIFVGFSDLIFQLFIEGVAFVGLEEYFRVDTLEEGSGRQVAWLFAWTQIQDYFFLGGGFGHDENIMRPNYYWLQFEGHDGGVHNSYLSFWFDAGIIGVVLYYGALLRIYFKTMRFSPVVIAFATSIFFNSTYESWMVASLNPFTIIFLIILTIFAMQLAGEGYVSKAEIEEVTVQPQQQELKEAHV